MLLYEIAQSKLTDAQKDTDAIKAFERDKATLVAMLRGEISHAICPTVNEVVMSHDYLSIYGKAVEDLVAKPVMPVMIGQDMLVTKIDMPGIFQNMIIRLPALAMIQPIELGIAMEYPEGGMTVGAASTSISIKKYGAKVSIAEEVIKQSQWPIVGAYLEAIGLAMIRLKEQKIFEAMENTAHPIFDNSLGFYDSPGVWTPKGGPADTTNAAGIADLNYITHGCNIKLLYNGGIVLYDILDMIVGLMNNGYQATDILMHPMSWMLLAKDPILRNFAMMTGSVGNLPWIKSIGPDVQGVNMPFALQLNMSPFVGFDKTATPYTTSIYVGCRNKTIALIQGDGPEQESWRDPTKDIEAVKVREYYGMALLDYGRGWTVAKKVNVAENFWTGTVEAVVNISQD